MRSMASSLASVKRTPLGTKTEQGFVVWPNPTATRPIPVWPDFAPDRHNPLPTCTEEDAMLNTLFSIAMSLSTGVTLAEAPAKPAPPVHRTPGCAEPERHELDFWLGDWDTFEPEGAPGESQARTHVDAILGG